MEPLDILGCSVHPIENHALDAWLATALSDPWDGRCRHIVTLNPEYVMAARRNRDFASAIGKADLSVADGVGVVVATRLLYGRRIGRVTGVDLIERLARTGESSFFLGAGPGIAQLAADGLRRRISNTNIAGVWSEGTPESVFDHPSLTRIAESHAKVVAVAYGAPNQVLWIQRNQQALSEAGVRIAIGVGGAFDYLSGAVQRPPTIVRRLGLEWLFRLAREPRRWRRQLVLPVFALNVLREAIMIRLRLGKRSFR